MYEPIELAHPQKGNLVFGVQEGKLVHISEVDRGLKANCNCPACGATLIARQGSKKAHHFAHYNAPECRYAVETALHLAAKSILEKKKVFMLPEYSCLGRTVHDPIKIDFDTVLAEKRTNNFVPDIILMVRGRALLVEIAVTHFVDEAKKKKIKEMGISTIEVDLSKLESALTFAELEKQVVYGVENKNWIYNAKRPLYKNQIWAEIEREREEEERREKQRQIEKERREEFYMGYYYAMTKRANPKSYTGYSHEIQFCSLKKKYFNGKYYANYHAHCKDCRFFRGSRNNFSMIVCLAKYHQKKEQSQ